MAGPPDDAYGRVTKPGRYDVVRSAAVGLIDDLVASFDLVVLRGSEADPSFVTRVPGIVDKDTVRLVPRAADAAPVTFAFTTFPGVVVHVGQWRTAAYPNCGCDACDENPVEVIEQLRRDIEAITAGRVAESWDGARLSVSTVYSNGSTSSGWSLVERDRHLYGEPGDHAWGPWRSANPADHQRRG